MKYNEFKEAVIKNLIKYKQEVLCISNSGTYNNKPHDHILPPNHTNSNLIHQITIPKDVKPHMYSHHLNSSQIMCINFFEPLLRDDTGKAILLKILTRYIPSIDPTVGIIDTKNFEYILYTKENTNFDFYLELTNGTRIFGEAKYTENGFGSTSPDKNYPDRYTKKWSDVYVNHLRNSLYLSDMSQEDFYKNYQIWRNISYIQSEKDHVIFLFPFDNDTLTKELEQTIHTSSSHNYSNVHQLCWHTLIKSTLELTTDTPYHTHYKEFYNKYLNYII